LLDRGQKRGYLRLPIWSVWRLKDEPGNIRSARNFNPDRRLATCFEIILCQFSAKIGGLDADYGVVSRVVPNRAAEHLCPDHSFPKTIDFALQGVFDDQVEKILGAFATREGVTPDQLFEVLANQSDLLCIEHFRLAG
jgi:hypothetical protein